MPLWTSVILLLCAALGLTSSRAPYYGKRLGSFRTLEHEVSGDIYAVDSKTIYIRNFNYDGQAPDAYFYAGSGTKPSNLGYKIPDETGGLKPLGAYKDQHLTLTLPNGVTLDNIQWFSVWCKQYTVDFGNLILPSPVTDYPRPQRIGAFVTSEHDVSSGDVVVVDSQTLLIPDFTYSGKGPDAHFWAGKGYKPSRNGFLVPNENGNDAVLTRYDSKTIVLTLPGEKTVFDIDYISVWCKSFDADFGHLKLHQRSLSVPPSLKTLGVRPQHGYGTPPSYGRSVTQPHSQSRRAPKTPRYPSHRRDTHHRQKTAFSTPSPYRPRSVYSPEPTYPSSVEYSPEPTYPSPVVYSPEPTYPSRPPYSPKPAYKPSYSRPSAYRTKISYTPESSYTPETSYTPESSYTPEPFYEPEPTKPHRSSYFTRPDFSRRPTSAPLRSYSPKSSHSPKSVYLARRSPSAHALHRTAQSYHPLGPEDHTEPAYRSTTARNSYRTTPSPVYVSPVAQPAPSRRPLTAFSRPSRRFPRPDEEQPTETVKDDVPPTSGSYSRFSLGGSKGISIRYNFDN